MKTVKSDLKGYYEERKESIENDIFAKQLKYEEINYYQVTHKDGDYIMTQYVQTNSKATIRSYPGLSRPNLYERLLYELSKDYKSIKIEVNDDETELIDLIKGKSIILNEEEKTFRNFKYLIFTVDLSNLDGDNISNEYKVRKYNYEEYLELKESEIKTTHQYNDIKLGIATFYKIYDDDKELVDTFTVITDRKQHNIYLNDNTTIIPGVVKSMLKELAKDYEYVVFNTFNTSKEAIKAIKEASSKVEDITPEILDGVGMINLQVNLK